MGTIDLSQRRRTKEPTVVTDGKNLSYTLPAFMPASLWSALLKLANATSDPAAAMEGVREVYQILFGEDHVDEAMSAIGINELQEIIAETYGATSGESPASPNS